MSGMARSVAWDQRRVSGRERPFRAGAGPGPEPADSDLAFVDQKDGVGGTEAREAPASTSDHDLLAVGGALHPVAEVVAEKVCADFGVTVST
jgi:hypothetical protein